MTTIALITWVNFWWFLLPVLAVLLIGYVVLDLLLRAVAFGDGA